MTEKRQLNVSFNPVTIKSVDDYLKAVEKARNIRDTFGVQVSLEDVVVKQTFGHGLTNPASNGDKSYRPVFGGELADLNPACKERIAKLIQSDVVAHPDHYVRGGIEVWDFIDAFDLGYELGNVVKYVARAGKKDRGAEIQDLEKASAYLSRRIEKLKASTPVRVHTEQELSE